MTSSFYSVHEYRRSAEQTTSRSVRSLVAPTSVDKFDPDTGLAIKTLDQILQEAGQFRFIDNPRADYKALLAIEDTDINKSPFTATGNKINWGSTSKPKVAIIGAGMSGLLTAFQLLKAGFDVEVFEATSAPIAPDGTINGAGRIKATTLKQNDRDSIVEYGAMRFPSTSYLYWSYMKKILKIPGTKEFLTFPNPGKIPSLFRGILPNNNQVTGFWSTQSSTAKLPSEYQTLAERHINVFLNFKPNGGTITTKDVIGLVKGSHQETELVQIEKFWDKSISQLSALSYRDFLSTQGFSSEEIKTIGYMGFGTGGFGSLFAVSALEILRLVIWDYAAELSNPEQYKFPDEMKKLILSNGGFVYYDKPVLALVYSKKMGKHVLYYRDPSRTYYTGGYDYVVLAMTHKAAYELLSKGEKAVDNLVNVYAEDPVFPFYDTKFPLHTSEIKSDLENQTGIGAIKIFHTIAGPSLTGQNLDPYISVNV